MKIHKELNHNNVVRCYDILENIYAYYLVLEHCPHGDLDFLIKNSTTVN
jgi:serine/threonine protein kinase